MPICRLAEQVIASDVRLDEMRSNAEKVALELLALEAPVASDLRTVVSAIWIVADMQRMGALAIHVAKAARRRHPAHVIPADIRPIVERMGRVGVHLADQAGVVLRERDVDLGPPARGRGRPDGRSAARAVRGPARRRTGGMESRRPSTSLCWPGSTSDSPTTPCRLPAGSSSWSPGRTSAATPRRRLSPRKSESDPFGPLSDCEPAGRQARRSAAPAPRIPGSVHHPFTRSCILGQVSSGAGRELNNLVRYAPAICSEMRFGVPQRSPDRQAPVDHPGISGIRRIVSAMRREPV